MSQNPSVDILPSKTQNEIPFALVKLPSKGLVYPKDHPFYNKESVEVREMTTRDENILYSEALIQKGTVLNELLQACIVNKSVDTTTLLAGDKAAILLAIRISAFTTEYKVTGLKCKACYSEFDHTFDLGKLELKELSSQPLHPNTNLFSYVLPKSKKNVKFCLGTDQVDLELSEIQKNKKKLGIVVNTQRTDTLKLLVKEIDGISDPQEIAKIIDNMSVYDSNALRSYMKKTEPDIIMKQSVVCPMCDEEEVKNIPMGVSFFWPTFE